MPNPPEERDGSEQCERYQIRDQIIRSWDTLPDEAAETRQRAHLEWELREVLGHVHPSDLTVTELLAMLAVLQPAHSRVLVNPSRGTPILRVITHPQLEAAEVAETAS